MCVCVGGGGGGRRGQRCHRMTEEGWSKGGEEGGGCSKRIQKTPDELHYVCLQLAEWLALMEGTELLIWAR